MSNVPVTEAFAIPFASVTTSLPENLTTTAPTFIVRYYFRISTTHGASPKVHFYTLNRKAAYTQPNDLLPFLLAFLTHLRYKELLTLYMIEFTLRNVDDSTTENFYTVANNFIHFYLPIQKVEEKSKRDSREYIWNTVRSILINCYSNLLSQEQLSLPIRDETC